MLNIEEGMKVKINYYYRDIKKDGFSRESGTRYVVCELNDNYVLLAKTKKQAMNGEGFIYHKSDVEKILGWY